MDKKEEKAKVKNLLEKGIWLFEKGNFKDAGKIFKQILASNPNEDVKNKAHQIIKKLSFDYVELAIGIGAFLLLAILYAYFGFLRS